MTLLEQLDSVDPNWRDNHSTNPIEAAVELGLLEPDALDGEGYEELDFED